MQNSATLTNVPAIAGSSSQTGADIETAAAGLFKDCMNAIYMYLMSMGMATVKIPDCLTRDTFGSAVVAKTMQAFDDSDYLCYWSRGNLHLLWKSNWDNNC
jgi:hypothetical protein